MNQNPICIVCGGRELSEVVRIEGVPVLCNQLLCTRGAALAVPTATVALWFCHACGHMFNPDFNPQLVPYGPVYENSLNCSGRFREYDDALIDALIERYQLRNRKVVEIGCGRGDFLKALCRRGGNHGVGFDPSCPDGEEPGDRGCDVVIRREHWENCHSSVDADFICSRHTLEHVGKPRAFLAGIRSAARKSGVPVFLEVPNSLYTLRDEGIWDIIYEHCSYFCASSLERALAESGYLTFDVDETFGGQFLTIHAETNGRSAQSALAPPPEVARLVTAFAEKYRTKVDAWARRLDAFAHKGRKVIVWGAGAKGTMFLNTLRRGNVEYVVDVNPRKQGKYVVGSGQRIVAPEFLKEYGPSVIICMNPNYREEIERRSRELGLEAACLVA